MKEIAIFLAEGFEEIEALTVVDLLRRAGIPAVTVSITGRKEVTGSHDITVLADKLYQDVTVQDFEMLVLPGGQPGTRNLEAYEPLMKELDAFYEKHGNIAAICAAPTIFGHRGYLQNKQACCFPGLEDQLQGATVCYDAAVTDDNVTTGRGMGAAIAFGCAIIERYQGKEAADAMAKKVVSV